MANPEITTIDNGSVFTDRGTGRDFTITDPTTETTYLEGTLFAVDSNDKLLPYVKGGVAADDGVAKLVLDKDITLAGTGDEKASFRQTGIVRKERLIILADGDASNVDIVETEQLRDYGIQVKDYQDLSVLDNS